MVAAVLPSDLPASCQLIPISPDGNEALVKICAIVHEGQGAHGASQLVLINSFLGGRVFLGALCDLGGGVREWLELWVQTVSGLHDSLAAREMALTNASLDLRWREMTASLVAADPRARLATGWENRHPPPVWLDIEKRVAVHLREVGTSGVYELCTDDAVLIAAGLDPFSQSLHRYLAAKGGAAGFIGATKDAPLANGESGREEGRGDHLLPFNPEGGYLFVRRLAPLELEQYVDVLSGFPFRGLAAGQSLIKLGGPYLALADWDRAQHTGRFIFSQRQGRSGRFLETLHLKLQLLADLLRTVRSAVALQRRPFLGLSIDSFRVGFAEPAGELPVTWTAHVSLVDGSAAVEIPTIQDAGQVFHRVNESGPSIFQPSRQSAIIRGRGELRLRSVRRDAEAVRIEGTLTASGIAGSSVNDIIRLRVPVPGGPAVELWGPINTEEGLVQGEARFRASNIHFDHDTIASLTRAEGMALPGTPFETIPVLSSPCDLFSLGVIGVRLFLAPGGEGLAIALDEIMSLGRALDAALTESAGQQARTLAAGDPRWVRTLGPQRHGHPPTTAEEAFSFVPFELWWDIVAYLARLFPGAGSMSYRRDLGDAPPHRIEAVFDQPITDLENIILRSQSLLLGDWMANREVAQILQRLR